MADITESIQNEEESGAVPQDGSKGRKGNEILSGANETDQLDRLHPDENKNREEIGSPPVKHVNNGSPEDVLREQEGEDENEGSLPGS